MRAMTFMARRHLNRDIGLVRFVATVGVLAAAVGWSLPMLDRAAASMKLGLAADVVLRQLAAARQRAALRGIAVCRSPDGVTCSAAAGWEQGWIAFEDRDGDGLRGAGEALLERAGPLPKSFRLAGSLQGGVFTLCSLERGGDARRISLHPARIVSQAAPAACR